MKKTALVLLGVCACHRHEDAARNDPAPQPTAAAVDTSVVASPAPSETAAAIPSASTVASATPPAVASAMQFGMIGLINAPDDSGAPWGREDALSARGNMWGDPIGDSFGAGGLGLRGTGDLDGGEGIGLGNIGTIGHGAGTGTGQGFGSGRGRLGGNHTNAPRVRQGTTTVNGRLPPEVIQRIVRQNFGRYRLCYEQGLQKDPKLSGKVAIKFVIDTQGAVSSAASDPSTTMSDASVVSCVTRGFSNLSFPQPEGGIVVVIYPLIFEPGDTP